MAQLPSKRLRVSSKTGLSRNSAASSNAAVSSTLLCENSGECRGDSEVSRNEVKSKQATLDRYWSKKLDCKVETKNTPAVDKNTVESMSETLEYESSVAEKEEVDHRQASDDGAVLSLETIPDMLKTVSTPDTEATIETLEYDSDSAAMSENSDADNLSSVASDSSPEHLELGASFDELMASCETHHDLPPLCSTGSHTILFMPDTADEQCTCIPKPNPCIVFEEACWDNNHVRLPYSPQNKLLVNKTVVSRWEKIVSTLNAVQWSCSSDLEQAILSYNKYKWDFKELHRYFQGLTEEEHNLFFSHTLPEMVKLAVSLPSVCTQPIPLLRKQNATCITISQQQAACLLANAFFCTFPSRNTNCGSDDDIPRLPSINFNNLYRGASARSRHSRHAKLDCLLHYFKRVTTNMPRGTLTFKRQVLGHSPDWANSTAQLQKLLITTNGTIEDSGTEMLQVDFANKYVGGGVLEDGCVQEEIRFVICPELIISRLITEELDANESLHVTGSERFSNYTGYGWSTRWVSDHRDGNKRDSWGRLITEIVAIDASVCHSLSSQLLDHALLRELNKAYCGFRCESDRRCAVATGNWGCGAFGGDLRLKALLQLMAAAESKRPVCYFTFGDDLLCREVFHLWQSASSVNCAVGKLWMYILEAAEHLCTKKDGTSSDIYRLIIDRCTSCLDDNSKPASS